MVTLVSSISVEPDGISDDRVDALIEDLESAVAVGRSLETLALALRESMRQTAHALRAAEALRRSRHLVRQRALLAGLLASLEIAEDEVGEIERYSWPDVGAARKAIRR